MQLNQQIVSIATLLLIGTTSACTNAVTPRPPSSDVDVATDASQSPNAPDGGMGSATSADGCAPKRELCNSVDDDCDGETDEHLTRPCERYCAKGERKCEDGEYQPCTVLVPITFYRDRDGDGFGSPDETTSSCDKPTGYVPNGRDCCDQDAGAH